MCMQIIDFKSLSMVIHFYLQDSNKTELSVQHSPQLATEREIYTKIMTQLPTAKIVELSNHAKESHVSVYKEIQKLACRFQGMVGYWKSVLTSYTV